MTLLLIFALIIGAYLIGSISSAILICKLLNLPDPRTTGSKNPGATNVLRLSNKSTAACVLLFDILISTQYINTALPFVKRYLMIAFTLY